MELPDYENARLNIPLPEPTSVSLAEPNPLLLDVAEFKLDEGEWEEQEEVLRIDNILRRRLGIPLKLDQLEQPWVSKQSRKPHDHKLQLRFRFKSTIAVEGSLLGVEKAPELTSVRLDGKELKVAKRGYFVDTDIDTIELPAIGPGNHVLELSAINAVSYHSQLHFLPGRVRMRLKYLCYSLPLMGKWQLG
jgi:hypothetical protein